MLEAHWIRRTSAPQPKIQYRTPLKWILRFQARVHQRRRSHNPDATFMCIYSRCTVASDANTRSTSSEWYDFWQLLSGENWHCTDYWDQVHFVEFWESGFSTKLPLATRLAVRGVVFNLARCTNGSTTDTCALLDISCWRCDNANYSTSTYLFSLLFIGPAT